ncbi:sensor histidine kinase [Candidatus Ferrigenium straubiae]|jgi:two-component system sensor histidine kinase AlgZ|uniref:sensor histidine kinase n=1 Tax=Candidatus Ferrigenium straubiae TaxID=2919506 RepID=UPI003F4AC4E8
MNKARSIKQNTLPDALPNFRNLGVTLRILLISNGLALLQALLQAYGWADVMSRMMQIATLLTPVLLSCLLLLWAAQPWLARLAYWRGALAVSALAAVVTLATYYFGGDLYRPLERDGGWFDAVRYLLLSVLVCGILLVYFRWRSQVLSRALHEARLQVLRARIRPHFLFNTINAVLSIVRAQPKQAEAALEDMSDLFRMAMAEAQDFVPLRQEIELGRRYIALEQLRMGERLRVDWQIRDVPDDALIPPLLLQPLLENAVYHGIEPLPQGGSITVALYRSGDELRIGVENPCTAREAAPHSGNKMALQNIRERLALLFDVEARYKVENGADFYRVEITLPYMKEQTL